MNALSLPAIKGYTSPINRSAADNSAALRPIQPLQTGNNANDVRQPPGQTYRAEADTPSRSTTPAEVEYIPARFDENDTPPTTGSHVRPEIQAFLNTSELNGTSRRGRFIDIQA
ncbi:MAG: hypothetical protein LRY66_02175 [Saccharospirillaceae bacterium]|nr:hypothetical protein [Saccharospirillaceae bacterium]MCD8530169.1 hypothetical protein [Saccharospirillaceae bacterium]